MLLIRTHTYIWIEPCKKKGDSEGGAVIAGRVTEHTRGEVLYMSRLQTLFLHPPSRNGRIGRFTRGKGQRMPQVLEKNIQKLFLPKSAEVLLLPVPTIRHGLFVVWYLVPMFYSRAGWGLLEVALLRPYPPGEWSVRQSTSWSTRSDVAPMERCTGRGMTAARFMRSRSDVATAVPTASHLSDQMGRVRGRTPRVS